MTVFVPFQPRSRPVPGVLLGTLALSAAQVAPGAAAGTLIGAVLGKTAGSNLTLADSHSGAVALSGTNLVVGLSLPAPGSFEITLRETLAGALNSPRDTVLTIVVAAAVIARYIAPTARGTGDGSTLANAAGRYSAPALIQQLSATGGVLRFIADEGDYAFGSGNPIVIATGPATADKRVVIEGCDSLGMPRKARLVGNRPQTTGGTGGSYTKGFQLDTGTRFLTFRNFEFVNFGNGCFFQNGHVDGLIVEDIAAYNVYRCIENGQSGEFGATLTNAIFRRIHVEGFERQTIRIRGGSHHILVEDIYGDAMYYDGDAFCTGMVIQTSSGSSADAPHDITIRRAKFKRIKQQASGTSYKNGDGIDCDSSSAESGGTPYNITIEGFSCEDTTDSGIDEKGIGTVVNGFRLHKSKRLAKVWGNDPAVPSIYKNGEMRAPFMYPFDTGGYCHVSLNGQNLWLRVESVRIHNRSPETVCSRIFYGEESRNGQKLDLIDWRYWNVNPTDKLFERGASPDNPYGITITYDPPLPTVTGVVTMKAGFSYGMVPVSTAVGTKVASCAFTSGQGAIKLVNNPGGYFALDADNDIVVAKALDYGAAPYFNIGVQFIYGIVGTSGVWLGVDGTPIHDADGPITYVVDPADDLTWQCYGIASATVTTAVLVSGVTEPEFDTFQADGLSSGAPALASHWAALYNHLIRRFKDAGLWDKRANLHLFAGPAQSWALRDLKSLHHATIVGALPAHQPKVGFTGSGNAANYITFPTMDPTALGVAWAQNNCGYTIRIETDSIEANAVMTFGTNTLLSARNASGAGALRVNAGGTGSIAGVTTSIGIWQAMRASATQYNIMQDGVVKSTINTASVALNAADRPRIFNGTNAHTVSFVAFGDMSVVADKTAERAILNDVRAIYTQFP